MVKPYNNRWEKSFSAAKTLSSALVCMPGVVGILAVGGLARKEMDDFADTDINIFVEEAEYLNWLGQKYCPVDDQTLNGVWIDLKVFNYQSEMILPWSIERRQERSRALILFDKNNKIKKLLQIKNRWHHGEKDQLIRKLVHRTNWYIQEVAYVSLKRKDLMQAHYCLNQALDWILDYCYVSKGAFVPFGKWKMALIKKNKLVEDKILMKLKQFMYLRSMTSKDVHSRIKFGVDLLKLLEIFEPLELFGDQKMYKALYHHHQRTQKL